MRKNFNQAVAICRHDAAVSLISVPVDVKSNRETNYGDLLWCPHCNRGFVKNMPDEEAVEAHYMLPSYYTQGTSHMPEVAPTPLDRLLVKLAWTFDHGDPLKAEALRAYVSPPGEALDIGSGYGELLHQLSELGFEAVGVEPDPKARAGACLRGVKVFDGTAENIPAELEGRKFKTVLMTHVLEHCRNPEQALQNVRALLAEGGVFYCEVPNCGSLYFQEFAQISEMLDVPRHLHFFTKVSLQSLCDLIGLEVLGWRYHGFTRHHHPSWRAWENSIHRKLEAHGVRLSARRRSPAGSLRLLLRSIGAPPDLKYDSIGFFARKP